MQSLVIQSLRDNVEVDEAMIGGVETRKGRSKGKKRKIPLKLDILKMISQGSGLEAHCCRSF
jgi:hypothetical protein